VSLAREKSRLRDIAGGPCRLYGTQNGSGAVGGTGNSPGGNAIMPGVDGAGGRGGSAFVKKNLLPGHARKDERSGHYASESSLLEWRFKVASLRCNYQRA